MGIHPKFDFKTGLWVYALALLVHLKCCNFRPTGPFGITLRAGCAMDAAVGLIPHCHWPSRTIYGTSRRDTAPAGGVWPAAGPEVAGISAAQ
jgi:hypothetical protein